MYLVVRSLKHNNAKIEYEIQQGDILKVGRVKFAVKEIRYKEKMDIDSTSNTNGQVLPSAHCSILAKDVDDYEEYEEVESIMNSACDDANST